MAGGGLLRDWMGKGVRQRFLNFGIRILIFRFQISDCKFQSDRDPLDKLGSW